MARASTHTFRMYTRLLRRDLKRSAKKLVQAKRRRGQLIVIVTWPRFKTSQRYYRLWKMSQKKEAPLRRNVAVAFLLLTLGFGGIAYALIQLSAMQPTTAHVFAARQEVTKPVAEQPPSMKRSLPTHLSIPDARVDTDLIQLGTNPDGSLATPDSYTVAGWYTGSPTPGEIGPAVITGHVDNYEGPAVFFYLKNLQPGYKIMVTRQDGSVATFAVTHVEQFDQDHFPTNDVYGNTTDAQLRLITCGGPFNHLSGEYTQNTVVYATFVGG